MFLVSKSAVGVTLEYLANAEEEHSKHSIQFGDEKLEQHLKDLGIKPEKLTPEIYSNYLEQENPHYKAKFRGGLAEQWKLEYSREAYTQMMSGQSPLASEEFKKLNGYALKKNGNLIAVKENAQTGLDSLSNCPKSVSIEFARSSKETQDKIYRAMDKSTEQLFDRIAKQIKPSCKDSRYQDIVPGSTKLMVASFTHYENRGYEENGVRRLEPNLHTHNSVQNFAEFEIYKHDKEGNRIKDKDGNFVTEKKILAIDPEEVFKRQLENSAYYDTLLNSNLQKEGLVTEPALENGHPSFRIAGYTKEMEESLSRRTQDLNKYVEEQKKLGNIFSSDLQAEAEYMKTLRQQTAQSKELHNTSDILANIKETVNLNITPEQQKAIDEVQKSSVQKTIEPDFTKIMKAQAFETDGVIEESKLKTSIIQEIRFSKTFNSPEELEAEVDKAFKELSSNKLGMNKLVQMEDGRYTRLDIILNEKALQNNVEIIKASSKTNSPETEQQARQFLADFYRENKKNGFKLNDGQLNACKTVIENSNICQIIGDAGTGKTTSVIRFANEYHSSKGKKVYGISVGTSTSRDLKDGNVKEENCLNTKEFLNKAFILDKATGQPSNELNKKFLKENLNSTIIFDEAGMCGSEDMKKITDFVKTANQMGGNVQLILVGDHKQLQSVSYGNAFLNTQKQLASKDIARLSENTRQKNQVAKDIAEGYRDKNIDKVFKALEENNLLVTSNKQSEVNSKLVNDYLDDASKSKIIVCGLNTEIDLINDEVRKGIIKQEVEKQKANPEYHSNLDYKNSVSINVVRKSGIQNIERKRSFCPGEEVVFLKNHKDKQAGWQISNSDRGTIKNIEQLSPDNFKLTVEIKGKEVTFETADYNNFNHSYAVSTHKSQGKTVDNTYHLGNASQASAQSCYVNGSRHKEQYKLYLAEDEVEKYKKNAVVEKVKATTLNDSNCQQAVKEYVQKKAIEEARKVEPMPVHLQQQSNKHLQLDRTQAFAQQQINEAELKAEKQLKEENARKAKAEAELKAKLEAEKQAKILRQKEFDERYGKLEKPNKTNIKEVIEYNFKTKYRNKFIEGKTTKSLEEVKTEASNYYQNKLNTEAEAQRAFDIKARNYNEYQVRDIETYKLAIREKYENPYYSSQFDNSKKELTTELVGKIFKDMDLLKQAEAERTKMNELKELGLKNGFNSENANEVAQFIYKNPDKFKDLPTNLKNDKMVVYCAVTKDENNVRHLNKYLKSEIGYSDPSNHMKQIINANGTDQQKELLKQLEQQYQQQNKNKVHTLRI